MSDSTTQRHGQDRTRINVHQPYELRDWADKFGVTPEQIEEAVRSVGNQAADVQEHLAARASSQRTAR
jgi:hypothetical protein